MKSLYAEATAVEFTVVQLKTVRLHMIKLVCGTNSEEKRAAARLMKLFFREAK